MALQPKQDDEGFMEEAYIEVVRPWIAGTIHPIGSKRILTSLDVQLL